MSNNAIREMAYVCYKHARKNKTAQQLARVFPRGHAEMERKYLSEITKEKTCDTLSVSRRYL